MYLDMLIAGFLDAVGSLLCFVLSGLFALGALICLVLALLGG